MMKGNKFKNENKNRAARMRALLEEISPLQRMVNSPGLDQTFNIFKRELPDAAIHEYPAGMEREDWIVPRSWQVVNGQLEDEYGRTIASTDENHLFVAPYSESVDGWFTKSEIERHLTTRENRPDSFILEHRNTYNYQLVDWGITLPYRRWCELPEGRYHVNIDVKWGEGSMKVGEYFLPGRSEGIICICAHIDELCNDDLSGCVLGMEIMRYLEQKTDRKYSYQLLWVPEMFGPLFYLIENPDVIKRTIGMLNLEAVGAGEKWCMKKALEPDTRFERTLRAAMRSTGIPFEELDFFDGYVNDEKVYGWPVFGIQGVAIQRHPFYEYHTSADVPDLIQDKLMLEALEISEKFIDIIEQDYIPEYINKLPPWLTRRGLYFDSKLDSGNHEKYNNNLLYNIDGKHSVLELAEKYELNFANVKNYLENLLESGVITKCELVDEIK